MSVTDEAVIASMSAWKEHTGLTLPEDVARVLLAAADPYMVPKPLPRSPRARLVDESEVEHRAGERLRDAALRLLCIDGVSAVGLDRKVTADWLLRLADGGRT